MLIYQMPVKLNTETIFKRGEMEEPSSPRTNQVDLKNCIEELVRFTLQSCLNEDDGFDLSIPRDLCVNLLEDDSKTKANGYPLYKFLASTLYECIAFGALGKPSIFKEDGHTEEKEEKNKLFHDTGFELGNLLKSIDFELHVQEPYFTQLKDGQKTIEGRCAVGDYIRITPGALILFNKCLVVEVKDVHCYGSFFEMLEAEGLTQILPGIKSIEEGVQVYRKFYTEEKEQSKGVIAIHVTKSAFQPYIYLARLLYGLNLDEVRNLLDDHITKNREYMEDVVKLALELHLNSVEDLQLGLSKDFCSNLLRDDPDDPYPNSETDTFEGVPRYPLYKRLALALLDSITFSGKRKNTMALLHERVFLKEKIEEDEELDRLILRYRSELFNFNMEKEGSPVHLSKQAAQPCVATINFLSTLSYRGVQCLLGFAHTAGTLFSALPPPRSALLSSFMSPYKPNVKGCKLTHGARALAKHVDRSGDKFWGSLNGNDSSKNKLALDVVNQLITSCCWLNVYVVQPHGALFEIRIAEGYGARWSKDGNKLIGFLEPYTDDGHSKGWKH